MEINAHHAGDIASLGASEVYESIVSGDTNDDDLVAAVERARLDQQKEIQRREGLLADRQSRLRDIEDIENSEERRRLERSIRVGRVIIEAMRQEGGANTAKQLIADILRARAEQQAIERRRNS